MESNRSNDGDHMALRYEQMRISSSETETTAGAEAGAGCGVVGGARKAASKAKRLSISMLKLHTVLKALSQCRVVIGISCVILGALADYISHRSATIRFTAIHEICGAYFIVGGIIGIMGSASHRRALLITSLVMALHSILIFAPIVVILSSFDIHFYQHDCYGKCNLMSLFKANSKCQVLCGVHVEDNMRGSMTRLGTDYRIDAGLISAAILEWLLAIGCFVVSAKAICGHRFCVKQRQEKEMKELNQSKTALITGGATASWVKANEDSFTTFT